MEEERRSVFQFVKKWIFHILAASLGICALFTKPEQDRYLALAIFLVTLMWIIRNVFSRDLE